MVDGLQSSEHGSPTQTLEVILTDVEHRGPEKREVSIVSIDQPEVSIQVTCLDQSEASIVYLRSNLWKNWVMKMCISSTLVTSFLSTSLKTQSSENFDKLLKVKNVKFPLRRNRSTSFEAKR